MSKPVALVLPCQKALDVVCAPETCKLITDEFDARFNETGADYTKEQQDALLGDAEVLLTTWGSPVLDQESLLKAPKLKYLGHAAGTVKPRVPFEIFAQARVFSAAGRIAQSVADWCMASLMASLRLLPAFNTALHGGVQWKTGDSKGKELFDMKVGIVSLSSTARAFIPLLKPFGCEIVAYDPYVSKETAEKLGVRLAPLAEVMANPVVSLHLPLLSATQGMITKELLSLIPDGGVLVNSSRGSVLDEKALIDELKANRIYAAMDVFDKEPLDLTSPLRSLPNVILTPHIAGATQQGHLALMSSVVKDILHAMEGKPTRYEVDPKNWELLA